MLAHEILHHATSSASKNGMTVYVLHGLLGSGKNLRTFTKNLHNRLIDTTLAAVSASSSATSTANTSSPSAIVDKVKNLKFVLIDLPSHGLQPPRIVIGHSFGGKVALSYLEQSILNKWNPTPTMTIVLDALPSAYFAPLPMTEPGNPSQAHKHHGNPHEESVTSVLEELSNIRLPISSKASLLHHLQTQKGYSSRMSQWMLTNIKPIAENNDPKYGFTWKFDLEVIQKLFRDHQSKDFWPFLRSKRMSEPGLWKGEEVFIVRAEKNRLLWTERHLSQFPQFNGPPAPAVDTALLPGAGHWVHSDRPNELIELILPKLRAKLDL